MIKSIMNIFYRKNKKRYTPKIIILYGDITEEQTDIIVNAADESMRGGTGIDGAIHEKAGPELGKYMIENIPYGQTGGCVITPGFNLPVKFIIHTVAPIYMHNEAMKDSQVELMESCFITCLEKADQTELETIIFPVLGAGAYGWKAFDVANIAKKVISESDLQYIKNIGFMAFTPSDRRAFEKVFQCNAIKRTNNESLIYHAGTSAVA